MTITQIACYFNQIICYLHAGMNWCSKTYSFHLKLYNLKLYFCQQKNISNCDIISQTNFEFSWMSKHLSIEESAINFHPCRSAQHLIQHKWAFNLMFIRQHRSTIVWIGVRVSNLPHNCHDLEIYRHWITKFSLWHFERHAKHIN